MKQRGGYTSYLPKRADANQPEIVATFRSLGFAVQHTHEIGGGVFDLLISKWGINVLAEVKDGSKPPSARQLTEPQKKFNFNWRGMRCVVTCPDDCVSVAAQVHDIVVKLRAAGIVLEVVGSPEPFYQPSLY